jgi:site-specific DNA-methyltransferase (adenine-specific)
MKAGQQQQRSKGGGGYHGGFPDAATQQGIWGDSGGASRFYTAKASRKERDEGNEHTTVKPLKLLEYLLTLLSRPTGGVILDPFAGSGSTLVAARRLGRPCIGIELDPHNAEICQSRLNL